MENSAFIMKLNDVLSPIAAKNRQQSAPLKAISSEVWDKFELPFIVIDLF